MGLPEQVEGVPRPRLPAAYRTPEPWSTEHDPDESFVALVVTVVNVSGASVAQMAVNAASGQSCACWIVPSSRMPST